MAGVHIYFCCHGVSLYYIDMCFVYMNECIINDELCLLSVLYYE